MAERLINHGATAYVHRRCRCDVCRAANRDRMQKQTASMRARLAAGEADVPHGRSSTYRNWGCRCRPCTDAHVAKCREYMQKRNQAATAA